MALFKHRLETFTELETSGPPNTATNWLILATRHPATFNAILYCGATMYADYVKRAYKQICPETGCLPYKIEAIRALNMFLGDREMRVTDEMIMAVLLLMNFDSVSVCYLVWWRNETLVICLVNAGEEFEIC